jgi:hypothetical protein
VHTVISSTTKENFQQALTVLLLSSHGGHLIIRRTLCYKYLFPSVPTKKQFFTSSKLDHPDYRRQVLQNKSSVLVNGPTVNTFTLPAHAYSALLQTDEDADNHKVKTWSMMLLPYVLLLHYVV